MQRIFHPSGRIEKGLPPAAGVALGIDRLVMLLSGARTVSETRAFCCTPDSLELKVR